MAGAELDPPNPQSFARARAVVAEASEAGIRLATPKAAALMTASVSAAVDRVVSGAEAGAGAGDLPGAAPVDAALALLQLTRDLDLPVDISVAQEQVFAALQVRPGDDDLRRLASALNLAG